MFFWISFGSNHLKLNMDNTEHNSQLFEQNLPLLLVLTAFFQIRSFQQLKFEPLKISFNFFLSSYPFLFYLSDITKISALLTILLTFSYFKFFLSLTWIVEKLTQFLVTQMPKPFWTFARFTFLQYLKGIGIVKTKIKLSNEFFWLIENLSYHWLQNRSRSFLMACSSLILASSSKWNGASYFLPINSLQFLNFEIWIYKCSTIVMPFFSIITC